MQALPRRNDMKKWFKLFRNQGNNYMQLASVNRRVINEYNYKTLSTLLLLGWVLVLLPLVSVPVSNTKADAVPAYLLAFSVFFILFLLFKIPAMKKYTYIGLYAGFSVLFLLGRSEERV